MPAVHKVDYKVQAGKSARREVGYILEKPQFLARTTAIKGNYELP